MPQNERLIQIKTYGLQINLMVRDDFEKWGSSKIELLTVIDDIRNRLKRLGLLRQTENFGMKNPYPDTAPQPAAKKMQGDMRHGSQTLRNIIC